MQISDLIRQEEEADATTVIGQWTRADLRDTFNRCLAPGQHWKTAITALCAPEERARYEAAIDFHVGGPTTFTPRMFTQGGEQIMLLVVTNAGYYANIGA